MTRFYYVNHSVIADKPFLWSEAKFDLP